MTWIQLQDQNGGRREEWLFHIVLHSPVIVHACVRAHARTRACVYTHSVQVLVTLELGLEAAGNKLVFSERAASALKCEASLQPHPAEILKNHRNTKPYLHVVGRGGGVGAMVSSSVAFITTWTLSSSIWKVWLYILCSLEGTSVCKHLEAALMCNKTEIMCNKTPLLIR